MSSLRQILRGIDRLLWRRCWGVWLLAAPAVNAAGIDVVAMKNGDIHNGTIAQDAFTVDTPYGAIVLPYERVAQIRMADEDGRADVLITRSGERFSGELQGDRIFITRVLDPTLPLALEDIDEIVLAEADNKTGGEEFPDAVEMRNGDRFRARIGSGVIMLKSETALEIIERDIRLLDIADGGGEAYSRARLLLATGNQQKQGSLIVSSILLETPYGAPWEAPVSTIEALAPNAGQRSLALSFDYSPQSSAGSTLSDQLRDGNAGPTMAILEGGKFRQGDLQGDGDGDESPPREIELAPFAIGIYEVTFEEYDRFCRASGRPFPDDEGWGRGRRPAVNLSWEDAHAFTLWLSEQTGENYRLPSDAEWEYAARADTQTRFWWGNDMVAGNANCEGCGSLWDGDRSAAVGKFPPNPFGLRDSAGNVFEWVADCFHDTFVDAPTDGSPLEKPGCGKRVIRGGAWSFPPKEIRSANRWRDFPSRRSDDTGFRVARDL